MTNLRSIKRSMRPARPAGIVFLACVSLSTGIAADNTLENQLADRYRDKVLALRHSFKSNSQGCAADGTPLKTTEEGSWTLYGRMQVKRIKVDGDRLTVNGTRAMYFFDNTGSATQLPEDRKHPAEKLKVEVLLQEPLSSVDEASAILSRIFALTPEDVLNSAPAYWRPRLAKQMGLKLTMSDAGKQDGDTNQSSGKVIATDDTSVFRLGDHNLKAPQAKHTPEPAYTDAARNRDLQGVVGLNVVIDPTGKVRHINIVHPIGMGLDDNAVATVGTWRFAPATKDDRPVAVAVYVEVDFRLYK